MNKLYSITLAAILGLVAFDAAGVIIPISQQSKQGTQITEAAMKQAKKDLADGLADIEQNYSSYLIKTCSPMAGGNRLVTYINPSYNPIKKIEGTQYCFLYERQRRDLPVKIVDGKPDYHVAIEKLFNDLLEKYQDQGLMKMHVGDGKSPVQWIAKYNPEVMFYFEQPMMHTSK